MSIRPQRNSRSPGRIRAHVMSAAERHAAAYEVPSGAGDPLTLAVVVLSSRAVFGEAVEIPGYELNFPLVFSLGRIRLRIKEFPGGSVVREVFFE